MRIKLAGHAPLARRQGLKKRPLPEAELVIDLTGLEFASPLEVTATALLANSCRAARIELPDDPQVRAYLGLMGLPEALAPTVSIDRIAPAARDPRHASIPLQHFDHPDGWEDYVNGRDGHEVLEELHRTLGQVGLANTLNIIGELVDNAGTHGSSPAGYYVAGQYYTGLSSGMPEGMWLAVTDAGIGIRNHLKSRYDVPTDARAIQLAFRRGVTGEHPPRGNGLVDVRDASGRSGPGRVLIRSGRGAGTFFTAPDRPSTASYRTISTGVSGTWVLVLAGHRPR